MTYTLEDTKKWLDTTVKTAKDAPENARLLSGWVDAISNESSELNFMDLNAVLNHLFASRYDIFTSTFLFYIDSDIVDELVEFFEGGKRAKVWRIKYARDLTLYEAADKITTTPCFNAIREVFDTVKNQNPGSYAAIVKAKSQNGCIVGSPISIVEFNGKADFWLKLSKTMAESSSIFFPEKAVVSQELKNKYLSVRRHIHLADLKLSEFKD